MIEVVPFKALSKLCDTIVHLNSIALYHGYPKFLLLGHLTSFLITAEWRIGPIRGAYYKVSLLNNKSDIGVLLL